MVFHLLIKYSMTNLIKRKARNKFLVFLSLLKEKIMGYVPKFIHLDHFIDIEYPFGIYWKHSYIQQSAEAIFNTYKEDTLSSLSAVQTTKIARTDCNLQIGLKEDYDTFDLQVNKDAFNIDLIGSESSSKADILYTDVEDKDQEKYLKSESIIVDDFDNYKINQETDLSTIPTLVSKSAMLSQSINPSSSTKFENKEIHVMETYNILFIR